MSELFPANTEVDFSSRGVDRMLTPAQVAALFGVDPKTVRRWAMNGQLPCTLTLGGHRRYSENAVRQLKATLQK